MICCKTASSADMQRPQRPGRLLFTCSVASACWQVRAPTHIVSTICDDRGEEPTYCGVSMSELMEADANVGDAIG